MRSRPALTRSQILGFRRRVGTLDQRLAPGGRSLRQAAWAGLHSFLDAVAAEAASLPLPGLQGRIVVRRDT